MKNIDEFKEVWKASSAQDAGFTPLSEKEISIYLKGRSHSVGRLFRNGLLIDIILKTCLGAALLYLALVVPTPADMQRTAFVILGFVLVLGGLQVHYLLSMPGFVAGRKNMRESLMSIIDYYETRHRTVLFIAAGTNPLLLLTGMLFYFFYTYGGIRPLDTTDFTVLSLFLLAGYVLGVLVPMFQYRFQIHQLRECLADLDESAVGSRRLQQQKRQRIRWFVAAIIALLAGLLLFILLVQHV